MVRRKEMKQLLEERAERIDLLEQRAETLEQLLDGYKAREKSIVDTLSRANAAAKQQLDEAQKNALDIGRNAETHAQQIMAEAQRQADASLSAARAESERMIAETQQRVQAYEALLEQHNANLERSAAEAEAIAARYASFLKERKVDCGELINEIGDISVAVPAGTAELEDTPDSPKTLMQNIYKIQNRDIPETAQRTPEQAAAELIDEIIADLGPRPADLDEPAASKATAAPAATVYAAPAAPAEPVYAATAAPAEPVYTAPAAPAAPAEPVYTAPAAPVYAESASMTHPVPKPGHSAEKEPVWLQEQEIEWQEDEGGSVPSVSELMPDEMPDEEVSLDSLLDEIISAGSI